MRRTHGEWQSCCDGLLSVTMKQILCLMLLCGGRVSGKSWWQRTALDLRNSMRQADKYSNPGQLLTGGEGFGNPSPRP